MQRKTGKEMRKLIFAITLITLLLVLAIITYFMVDIIITINDNIEDDKKQLF